MSTRQSISELDSKLFKLEADQQVIYDKLKIVSYILRRLLILGVDAGDNYIGDILGVLASFIQLCDLADIDTTSISKYGGFPYFNSFYSFYSSYNSPSTDLDDILLYLYALKMDTLVFLQTLVTYDYSKEDLEYINDIISYRDLNQAKQYVESLIGG